MGWILAVIVILGAAIALWQQRSGHEKTVRSLRDLQAKKIEEQQREHDARIEELEKRLARLTREQETNAARAHLPLAKELLSGMDDLERAISNARSRAGEEAEDAPAASPNEGAEQHQDLIKGLEMVNASLQKALARHGITPIAPEPSATFDPAVHEAIAVTEDANLPHNSVHQLMRTGWQHETQLLRPAMVQISQVPVEEDSFEKTMPEIPSSKSQEVTFSFEQVEEEEAAASAASDDVETSEESEEVKEVVEEVVERG